MPVAETLGVVASIIAIVQITKKIISLCQFYIDSIDGAPSDLRVIPIEVSIIRAIAKSLKFLTEPDAAPSDLLEQLGSVTGPIEGCKAALLELQALLPALETSSSKRRRGNKGPKILAKLAWCLKAGKAKKLLQEIVQHKTMINVALTTETLQDLKDLKQKGDRIESNLTARDHWEVCE